jgi:hypothetical protein
MQPSPPLSIYGPITSASRPVRTPGILAQSEVKILQDGTSIGQSTAPANGEVLVPLPQKPILRRSINATHWMLRVQYLSDPVETEGVYKLAIFRRHVN